LAWRGYPGFFDHIKFSSRSAAKRRRSFTGPRDSFLHGGLLPGFLTPWEWVSLCPGIGSSFPVWATRRRGPACFPFDLKLWHFAVSIAILSPRGGTSFEYAGRAQSKTTIARHATYGREKAETLFEVTVIQVRSHDSADCATCFATIHGTRRQRQ